MEARQIDIWSKRHCERCGAQPGEYCRSASGRETSHPHRERYPEGPPRTFGKQRAKKMANIRKRAEKTRRMPLSLALAEHERKRMEAFRMARSNGN